MLVTKILFNSSISMIGACFMTMDIINFYLKTPLKCPEFICVRLSDIPEEIIQEYKLHNLLEHNDSIYIKITLGMYRLPHTGLLANKFLEKRLNTHGYHQSKSLPGLWKHAWCPIWFTLAVDNFGVKFVGKEHALHIKSVLKSYYPLSTDWTRKHYISITLDWDYENCKVHLSMPGYVTKALKQFQHKQPSNPQHAPFPTRPIKYRAKNRMPLQHQWPHFLITSAKNSSNKCVENSYSLAGPLTPLYCVPLVLLHHNLPNPPTTLWIRDCDSLTI
ncbi:hypothetical protein ACHAW6_005894 [Cyclotella cf. meneghiniana]